MAQIITCPTTRNGAFDDCTTLLVGNAFDAACEGMGRLLTHHAREDVAARIIEAAAHGERNLKGLIDAGLKTPSR